MQELRLERSINRHLFHIRYSDESVICLVWLNMCNPRFSVEKCLKCNCREEFKHYLGRPDLRQELVSQWQKDFNSVPDDMREDEETKAELHLRLDVRLV